MFWRYMENMVVAFNFFFLFFGTIRSFPVNCICSLIVYLSIRYVCCSLPNLSIFRMLVELRDLKVKMDSKISK